MQSIARSSPRPWRCFQETCVRQRIHKVFSTSVEVFPIPAAAAHPDISLLHVRGGVSRMWSRKGRFDLSSPRPWRCFFASRPFWSLDLVFSTSVEVFLPMLRSCVTRSGLLHVRGGVSRYRRDFQPVQPSSPRPWRCFHEPQDRSKPGRGLLHVRGGVSEWFRDENLQNASSPRPWRCFPTLVLLFEKEPVFSTSVEVFLELFSMASSEESLLHVRGGVSRA